jgi:hypothetical protein
VCLIYHCLQSPRSEDCPVEGRRDEHDPDWQQLIPTPNKRDDRVWWMCRCYSRDKEKLEVEIRWEDAFLQVSELRKGNSTIANPGYDECLKESFIVRYLNHTTLLLFLPDIAPSPGATHKSVNGMAPGLLSNQEHCTS